LSDTAFRTGGKIFLRFFVHFTLALFQTQAGGKIEAWEVKQLKGRKIDRLSMQQRKEVETQWG
jgi:hypothetical protein